MIFIICNATVFFVPEIKTISKPDHVISQFDINPFYVLSDVEHFTVNEHLKKKYSLNSENTDSFFVLNANNFMNSEVIQRFKGNINDYDNDGFPDICELYGEDTVSFRNWFVALAIDQKANHSDLWKERDCSGLVRFSYRESLKSHDSSWIEKSGISGVYTQDIKAYNYPNVPVIGTNLFYDGENFVGFADARHLLLFNTERVSRERDRNVKKGDIAFFYHPQDIQFPYHVMIYTGDGFIYHTGPTEEDEGYLRLWNYEDYLRAAPLTWLPVKENPNFLGFYKFKILND